MNLSLEPPSLSVSVANMTFDSPVMLASGTLGDFPQKLIDSLHWGAGAVVTRTVREFPDLDRSQTPTPRYYCYDGTMLNCEWGNSHPWRCWFDKDAEQVAQHGPLILSISGRDINSAVHLVQKFNKKNITAYEFNISCPHSNKLFGQINEDHRHLRNLLTQVKQATSKPVWIKLGWSSYVKQMAKVAEDYGADAIVTTNSIGPGLAIDIETGVPHLGIKGGLGGVSGTAIRPLALATVYELAQMLNLPIIGCGGISNASDVLEFLMAGASAVQLYTAAFLNGLNTFEEINAGLKDYLMRKGYTSIKEVQHLSHNKANSHCFSDVQPTINTSSCAGCDRCSEVCLWDALPSKMPGDINKRLCVGCNACADVCPVGCIKPGRRVDPLTSLTFARSTNGHRKERYDN